jgi:hypothetical protein
MGSHIVAAMQQYAVRLKCSTRDDEVTAFTGHR